MPANLNCIIYINGTKHRCTELGPRFFADTPEHPGIPCSQHSLKPESVEHLKAGGVVFTSGNRYSLSPSAGEGVK